VRRITAQLGAVNIIQHSSSSLQQQPAVCVQRTVKMMTAPSMQSKQAVAANRTVAVLPQIIFVLQEL
jgi:hypothetical protein